VSQPETKSVENSVQRNLTLCPAALAPGHLSKDTVALMKTLQLAITEFAVPAPRQGSIEAYSGYGGLPNLGNEIHAQIQAQRSSEEPNYQAEKLDRAWL
jgi:hypothetical protein